MAANMTASKETLIELLNDLRDERIAALLDYAEYLLRKQAEEDAADISDSQAALEEAGSVAWDAVKREIDARVHD